MNDSLGKMAVMRKVLEHDERAAVSHAKDGPIGPDPGNTQGAPFASLLPQFTASRDCWRIQVKPAIQSIIFVKGSNPVYSHMLR